MNPPCGARATVWHWLAAAALACPALPAAGQISERRLGDTLSFALPATTLGRELWRGDGAGAGQFTRSFAVTLAATELLKRSTAVERPDHSDTLTFPSGHASRAFAAATFVHRRHGLSSAWALYALATYVGYTRVQAQRHSWVDVLGSAGVAAASSWLLAKPRRDGPAGASVPSAAILVFINVPLQ